MNKVFKDIVTASELPERLRHGLPGDTTVSVTVEALDDDGGSVGERRAGHFSRFRDRRRDDFSSMEEIDRHVADLRTEWDER